MIIASDCCRITRDPETIRRCARDVGLPSIRKPGRLKAVPGSRNPKRTDTPSELQITASYPETNFYSTEDVVCAGMRGALWTGFIWAVWVGARGF